MDVSDVVGEWDIIQPEHLLGKVEVRRRDVVIFHTGWHDYFGHGPRPNLDTYLYHQPGGGIELDEWIVEMDLKWIGIDCGPPDHPMNNGAILKRCLDLVEVFEKKMG